MEGLLENLHLYEIVLLFLGVFLFMILSGALIYYVIKKEEIKKLLLFFMIPIIMIGYPSIQEIQFENALGALMINKEKVKENPNDSVAKEKIEKLILKVEDRVKSARDIAMLSEAYLLIEKPEKAIVYADKALAKENTIVKGKEAPSTQDKIIRDHRIKTLKDYKVIATLQEDIKSNKISVNDTAQIKLRLKNTTVPNAKLNYINKMYLTKTSNKTGN